MSGIQIPVGIETVNPVPADYKYGPWASLAAARTAIPQALRYDGLTVRITGLGEYNWLAADLSDSGLVVKSAGGGSGGALAKVNSVYLVNSADVTPMGGSAANVYSTFQAAYDAAVVLQVAAGGSTKVYLNVGNVTAAQSGNLTLTANYNSNVIIKGINKTASVLGTVDLSNAIYSISLSAYDVTVGNITSAGSVILSSVDNCVFGSISVGANQLSIVASNTTFGALVQTSSSANIINININTSYNVRIASISRTHTATTGNFTIGSLNINNSSKIMVTGTVLMSLNNDSGAGRIGGVGTTGSAINVAQTSTEISFTDIIMQCSNSTGSPIYLDAYVSGISLFNTTFRNLHVNNNVGKGGYLSFINLNQCIINGDVVINNFTADNSIVTNYPWKFQDVQFIDPTLLGASSDGIAIVNDNHTIKNGITFSNISSSSAANYQGSDVGPIITMQTNDISSAVPMYNSSLQFKNVTLNKISIVGSGNGGEFSNVYVNHLVLQSTGTFQIVHCGQRNSETCILYPTKLPDFAPAAIYLLQSTFWVYDILSVWDAPIVPMFIYNSFVNFFIDKAQTLNLELYSSTVTIRKDNLTTDPGSINVLGKANTSNLSLSGYLFNNMTNNNSFFELDLLYGANLRMEFGDFVSLMPNYELVETWNDFFGATVPFTYIQVDSNDFSITIYGGKIDNFGFANPSLINLIDTDCINSLMANAFKDNSGIVSASFTLVDNIPDSAFENCTSLTIVTAPAVTALGNSSFKASSNLGTLTMSNITTIGANTFENCTSLNEVDFGLVETVGDDAFVNTLGLGPLVMNNVTNLGFRAFKGSGVATIQMDALVEVFESSFENCPYITDVTMSSLDIIGDKAFKNCENLGIVYASGVTSIGAQAFQDCINMYDAAFIGGVTTLATMAFKNCPNITSIPEIAGLTGINDEVFLDCTSLYEMSFPNVTYVGINGFKNTGLTEVNSTNFPAVTTLNNIAFGFCTALTTVNLPLLTAGTSGFPSCTALTSASFAILTFLDFGLLAFNTALTTLNIPSVATTAEQALIGCTALETISMPAATYIANETFKDCTGLTTISLPVCTSLGSTSGNGNVFLNISGNAIDLIVPTALMTNNGGNPDGDIQYLQANNTVNVITV